MVALATNSNFPITGSTTTSTTFVDTDASMTYGGAADMFLAYRASFGGNDASQIGEVQCVSTDGTVYGLSTAESNGTDVAYGGGQLQGFARLIGSGSTETIKLQHRNTTSSDTNRTDAKGIIYIPLNQAFVASPGEGIPDRPAAPLTENADFFYSGTNSATAEVSSIGNTWTTVRTVDFDLPISGDYFVFFSVETTLTSGSATDGHQARFQIAGTTQGAEWVREWEDDTDRANFAYSDRVNLSAGTTTFRIQVQNRNANSTLSAYRSRIWAFDASKFMAGSQDVETTGDSAITHTAYADAETYLTVSLSPPNVGGDNVNTVDMVAFATVNLGSSGTGIDTLAEIRDSPVSSGGAACGDSGYGFNDAGLDSGDDLMPTILFHKNSISVWGGTGGFRVRTRISAAGTGTAGRNAGNTAGVRNNLFMWPMWLRSQGMLNQNGDGVMETEA